MLGRAPALDRFRTHVVIPRRVLAFALLCALSFTVIGTEAFSQAVTIPVAAIMATIIESTLKLLGVDALGRGDLVLVPPALKMRISADCVAVPAYATLVSLEASLARRFVTGWTIACCACAVFFVVNTARILSLALLWLHVRGWYEFVHEVAWNVALFVLVTSYVWWRIRPECVQPPALTAPSSQAFALQRLPRA